MTQNLPENIMDRPLRHFPNLLPNLFLSPLSNFFEEDFFPQEMTTRGVRIYEEGNKLNVELPLPGINSKDIEVSLNKGVLFVKGSSEEKEQDKKRRYYRTSKRNYSYSFALPTQIDEKQEPQAEYADGILKVTLQLAKTESEAKKIPVKAGNR